MLKSEVKVKHQVQALHSGTQVSQLLSYLEAKLTSAVLGEGVASF